MIVIKNVIKRDGCMEEFDINKILIAVQKAYKSCKEKYTKEIEAQLIGYLETSFNQLSEPYTKCNESEINIEHIQNILEDFLMSVNKNVAKAFILYRSEHSSMRDAESMSQFIDEYIGASNAATGSKFDPNANIEQKNICTLQGELSKKKFIDLNRYRLTRAIKKRYSKLLSKQYIEDLNNHLIYKHDETSISSYCLSMSMYPFLKNGMKSLGGPSTAPTNLESFCGQFCNMVFAVSSQVAGAVATPEFLMYLDYFIRKEFGNEYIDNLHKIVRYEGKNRSIKDVIEAKFQQVVHTLNQPAAARNFQSVFWNIGYFDSFYFKSMFETFRFPDNSAPKWETLSWLQKDFMQWFNNERLKTPLTFPVETMALLTDGNNDYMDKEYADFTAKMYSKGHSFFTYISDSADSLSSCCRLRNQLTDNQFSFSLGAGGVMTGSKSVMTINMNRLIQDAMGKVDHFDLLNDNSKDEKIKLIHKAITDIVQRIHKYQICYNDLITEYYKAKLMPIFDAGYIDLKKQYLTIGINGWVEACEYLGFDISDNDDYKEFTAGCLQVIKDLNASAKTSNIMFNTEFVPAEGLGVKNAKWDKQDEYYVPRDVYNSYFYKVEDENLSVIDKFGMHGETMIKSLDGGSALHMNLDEHLTQEQYRHLLNVAVMKGCNYFTFNIPNGCCEDCGYISKHKFNKCPKCDSENVTYLTRIIGYLKKVSSFAEARQKEAEKRHYHKND